MKEINKREKEKKKLQFQVITGLILGVFLALSAFSSCEKKNSAPPDFRKISETDQKKEAFFAFLSPIVSSENDRIKSQRDRLLKIYKSTGEDNESSFLDRGWLEDLADSYEVPLEGKSPTEEEWGALMRRVDTVPKELVLVQAAIESAWGTSRFARDGNNFFGEHCTAPGCGIVPEARPSGQNWEVEVFDSPNESVRSYLHNLNTHEAYAGLRRLREKLRQQGKTPNGVLLARALEDYSERGHKYVRDVQTMIRTNREKIHK